MFAQRSQIQLDFTDLDDGYPGYESPKDGENHLIYSTSFGLVP